MVNSATVPIFGVVSIRPTAIFQVYVLLILSALMMKNVDGGLGLFTMEACES